MRILILLIYTGSMLAVNPLYQLSANIYSALRGIESYTGTKSIIVIKTTGTALSNLANKLNNFVKDFEAKAKTIKGQELIKLKDELISNLKKEIDKSELKSSEILKSAFEDVAKTITAKKKFYEAVNEYNIEVEKGKDPYITKQTEKENVLRTNELRKDIIENLSEQIDTLTKQIDSLAKNKDLSDSVKTGISDVVENIKAIRSQEDPALSRRLYDELSSWEKQIDSSLKLKEYFTEKGTLQRSFLSEISKQTSSLSESLGGYKGEVIATIPAQPMSTRTSQVDKTSSTDVDISELTSRVAQTSQTGQEPLTEHHETTTIQEQQITDTTAAPGQEEPEEEYSFAEVAPVA